jgi:antitoxin HicB
MNSLYPALIHHDSDGRFRVAFPDLPEAISEGTTMKEVLFNAAEVLTLTLEGRMDEDLDIPLPSVINCAYIIAPAARVQAALLIRKIKGAYTLSEIARKLHTSWPSAARLADPHHSPSIRQLERAATSLGQCLVISLKPIEYQQNAGGCEY